MAAVNTCRRTDPPPGQEWSFGNLPKWVAIPDLDE